MAYRKYRNKKVVYDGIKFDSEHEAKRYIQLKQMERDDKISNLRLQVKYELLPVMREPDTVGKRGGIHRGKVIERAVSYYADFVYTDNATGETIVEDAKGERTKEYILKRKMCLYLLNIRIHEV